MGLFATCGKGTVAIGAGNGTFTGVFSMTGPFWRRRGYNAAMISSLKSFPPYSGKFAALTIALAGSLLVAPASAQQGPVLAQQENGWIEGEFARSRLVADYVNLPVEGPVTVFLGWEVVMPPGWKTYWRTPGEAGKPPAFNWQGSVNLATAEPMFPLPERFELFNVQNLGYAGRLLLPIRITPQISGAPISVKVTVDFLICKDICVPMEAEYQLDLPVARAAEIRSAMADDIHAALARVPRPPGLPEKGAKSLMVRNARVFGPAGNQRLTIDIAGPELLSAADVFVEAGPGVMFDAPRRALIGDGNMAQLTFSAGDYSGELDLRGRTLTLTVTDGLGRAIEVPFTLAPR